MNTHNSAPPTPSPSASPSSPQSALEIIAAHARDGMELRHAFFARHAELLQETAVRVATALAQGHKILLCGNGGSAADAQHLAGELVNRFLIDRPPLPAVALSTDTSVLTAVGNDFSFDQVFAKQVRALGQPGDVLLAISTSGNSPNVLEALRTARELELLTVGFTGQGGGAMATACDILLDVPHALTPLVQEVHIAAGHVLCQLIDYFLFENVSGLALTPAE